VLRHILRRLLWIFPSVLGVSLLTFYLLSLLPAETISPHSPHARYRELPLFFNASPRDIRTRVATAIDDVVASEESRAARGRSELSRLGGAALPLIIPELDALAPEARARLALALAPLAKRMTLDDANQAADARTAVRFWARFWETSEVEFRPAAAKSAVRRYALFGTVARERELLMLDTYSLPAILDTLPKTADEHSLEAIRRLTDVLAHVTGRDDRLGPAATVAEASAISDRWRRWWLSARAELVQLVGTDRLGAFALETRYGKWALETISVLGGGPAGTWAAVSAAERGARIRSLVKRRGPGLGPWKQSHVREMPGVGGTRPSLPEVRLPFIWQAAISPAVLRRRSCGTRSAGGSTSSSSAPTVVAESPGPCLAASPSGWCARRPAPCSRCPAGHPPAPPK
jgi:hypothetical protein